MFSISSRPIARLYVTNGVNLNERYYLPHRQSDTVENFIMPLYNCIHPRPLFSVFDFNISTHLPTHPLNWWSLHTSIFSSFREDMLTAEEIGQLLGGN